MGEDVEIKAMAMINEAFSQLDETTVARVLRWAADRYKVGDLRKGKGIEGLEESEGSEDIEDLKDLAGLYAAANPSTESEKALVVSYWFQEIQSEKDFTGQQVNTQLKHLGHGVGHITHAFSNLTAQKPQPVIQIQKSGTSQQARKKYRLTTEGIRKVKAMLAKNSNKEG